MAKDYDFTPKQTPEKMSNIANEISRRLGHEFEVIYEPGERDHIHVEFDPKFPSGVKT